MKPSGSGLDPITVIATIKEVLGNIISKKYKASTITTTAKTVGVTATLLAAANAERTAIYIYNNDITNVIYIGGSDVTITNGMPIHTKSCSPTPLQDNTSAIYGISAVAGINVRVMEY